MLTDMAVRAAKAREKPYKLSDALGLYLHVQPNGSRMWRLKYRINGREKTLSFGKYPAVTLTAARQARDDARAELQAGRDPSLTRRQRRAEAAMTNDRFRPVSEEWIKYNAPRWSKGYLQDVTRSFERHVWPKLGHVPMREISAPMIVEVLRPVERASPETAHRVRGRISSAFVYGIACGVAESDPAAQIRGLLAPVKKGRQPAVTSLPELRVLLKKVEQEPAHPLIVLAHRMLALTAVRSGELRGMRRDEVEGDLWTIPAERMKMKREHVVALPRQALDILEAVKPLSGNSPLVFPGLRRVNKPLSDMTLSMLLRRAGYSGRHVPHGWRSSFSSVMNERRPADRAVIDLMLAHQGQDKIEAAYNRAGHLERRREIVQEWADLILEGCVAPEEFLNRKRR